MRERGRPTVAQRVTTVAAKTTPQEQLPPLPEGYEFKRQGGQWMIVHMLDGGRGWRPLSDDNNTPAMDAHASNLLPILGQHLKALAKDKALAARAEKVQRTLF